VLMSSAAGAAQEAQPGSTLTVTSRLVVVDVVVTDHSGKPVTNLSKDKFVIYEDGIKQTVKDFDPPSGHMMPAGCDVAPVVKSVADLPKIGTAPVNVLVFDELNTPFHDLAYARQQMEKYLMSQPEVLPVPTLFVAAGNTKMAVLHDYTQSRAELLDSVKKHTADFDFTAMIAQLNGGKVGKDDGMVETLGALSQIAESLRGVPGRKNVIWIGKGYNNAMDLNNLSQADHDRAMATIQQVTDRMLAARATLYSIDPEGPIGASDATLQSIDPTAVGSLGMNSGTYGDNLGFDGFVTATGGRTISGRNDLNVQLAQLTVEGTEYYTLSYVPTSPSDAARAYRKIRVVVNDPNLIATTRQGYFSGDAPVSTVVMKPRAQQPKDLKFDLMSAARTTLPYTGLHMEAQKSKNGFNLLVNASDLKFADQPDGTRMAEVTVEAVCFDRNKKITSQHTAELKEELEATDKIEPQSKVGFAFPMVVPAFTDHVRFVMRDAATGTMGSAEIKP
jgi:VWFA-related protein